MRKRQKTIVWILIAAWMIVIFMFSAQDAETSGDLSEGFLRKCLLWFLPEHITNNVSMVDTLEHIVRKCAHMAEFAVLGLLYSIQLYLYKVYEKDRQRIGVAVILVLLYAATDEVHQLFVGGRSGQVTDVLIDTIGGFIGTMTFYLWKCLTINRKKQMEEIE